MIRFLSTCVTNTVPLKKGVSMIEKTQALDAIHERMKVWKSGLPPVQLSDRELTLHLFHSECCIAIRSIPEVASQPVNAPTVFAPATIEDMERNHIRKMLDHCEWNKSEAARKLGIERSTLDRKLKSYGVSRPT